MYHKQLACSALLLTLAATETSLADALDQRLIGAWAPSASECKEIFETKAGALTFRRPINTFDSAFIIRNRDVQGVNGSCHIDNISSNNGSLRIKLDCRTAISFLPVDARVKILSETKISYGDFSSDPTIDATYERCVP